MSVILRNHFYFLSNARTKQQGREEKLWWLKVFFGTTLVFFLTTKTFGFTAVGNTITTLSIIRNYLDILPNQHKTIA